MPHRILAVDDVLSNLLLIKSILPAPDYEVTGCRSAEEALEVRGTFDLVLLDVLLPGEDGYSVARRLRDDPAWSGVPIIFLTSLQDEDEVVRGFEAGGVDFVSKPFHQTELLMRVRTHLALRDRTRALVEANEARDRFFALLAHDLRNPLAGFQSLVQELLRSYERVSPEELREILAAMGTTSQNLNRLLETLLDWGRSQTGALELHPLTLYVRSLVDEAYEVLEDSYRAKEIAIELAAGMERVRADRATSAAILRNLLSNAWKFTRPGGRVRVTSALEGREVKITVEDTGVGIPPDRLARLFRPDQKISTPGTAREPGTGLGLILCEELARKNGGRLEASSQPGQGSQFHLYLPAQEDER